MAIVAFDMDGVICDFEASLYDRVVAEFGQSAAIEIDQRRTHNAPVQYFEEKALDVSHIAKEPGFYFGLKPIWSAIGAMNILRNEYELDVIICSSPLSGVPHCAKEKLAWVDRYLGPEWADRVILTRDKTLVRADVLVDDKPKITGLKTPTWTHLLVDAPYNQDVEVEPHHRVVSWFDGVANVFHCLAHPLASYCYDIDKHLTSCDDDGYCTYCGFQDFIPS